MAWYLKNEEPPARPQRRTKRRKPLIALLSCLGMVGSLFFIIQNRDLLTPPGRRFISQVAYSANGKRLAWTSEGNGEGRIAVWDFVRPRQGLLIGPRDSEPDTRAVSTYTSMAFPPDGRTIATGTRSTPDPDPRVIIWDCQSGLNKQILRGHSDAVFAVAFSPEGKTLFEVLDQTVTEQEIDSVGMRAPKVVGGRVRIIQALISGMYQDRLGSMSRAGIVTGSIRRKTRGPGA